ncbi:hypothetical protein L195_g047616, partial [Trifolium pratense]
EFKEDVEHEKVEAEIDEVVAEHERVADDLALVEKGEGGRSYLSPEGKEKGH